MLATLSARRAFGDGDSDGDGDGWIFERKLDGVRVLATRRQGSVRLYSRAGNRLEATYPEVAEALAGQESDDFTLDGEVVALRAGRTDFALLQQRMQLTDPEAVRAARHIRVTYYVFDLLSLDGQDTTRLPLRTRKALLRDAFGFGAPLRFTPHRNHYEPALLDRACAQGWEGLIAKRADARYVHRRTTDWLKLKCSGGQELVICGFTEPQGLRVGFGALLLGHYEGERLRYAGKVGTGYDTTTLRTLRRRLDDLGQERSPFAAGEVRDRNVHWVRPELVAQVAFTEWTTAGLLRHPRFLGLRDDKPARAVVRERPEGKAR